MSDSEYDYTVRGMVSCIARQGIHLLSIHLLRRTGEKRYTFSMDIVLPTGYGRLSANAESFLQGCDSRRQNVKGCHRGATAFFAFEFCSTGI
jgi:hypothetical protein